MTRRSVTFLLFFLSACGAAPAARPNPAISEARAREIALETGTAGGYDPALYTEVSARWEEADGTWWVHVEQTPPTPPGGFYAVVVDGDDGAARLVHGE